MIYSYHHSKVWGQYDFCKYILFKKDIKLIKSDSKYFNIVTIDHCYKLYIIVNTQNTLYYK